MRSQKVILVGNGLNRVSKGYSWEQLLNALRSFVGGSRVINFKNKPFPLLYEELYLECARNKTKPITEYQLKQFVADRVEQLEVNSLHEALVSLDTKHILTTNYDYTLEKAFTKKENHFKTEGFVNEQRYSLFRSIKIQDRHFWHIHGDQRSPNSITLGYEHYSGYLQQMRAYTVSGVSYKKAALDPLMKRLRQGIKEIISWIDFFFTEDIYIIGLSMDFLELHLWWLLTYRARTRVMNKTPVLNKIYYLYPTKEESKIIPKLGLLRANEVKITPIDLRYSDWETYYRDAIDFVRNNR